MNEEDLKNGMDEASENAAEVDASEASESIGGDEKELESELEELRDTFQTVLDETTEQAQNDPVIQELDYHPEEPVAEAVEDAAEETEARVSGKNKKKDKKGKKKIPAAAIIIPVVICVLIIVPLLAYFILTVKEPDFNKFLSAYVSAETAQEAAEKVADYESALGYCTDESILAGFKQDILENLVVAKCEAEGYQAAYTYMNENMTDEMKAAPSDKKFKEFLTIGDSLSSLVPTIYDKVVEAVGDKTDDSDVDYNAIVAELGISSLITEEVKGAVVQIGAGVAGENAANGSKEAIQAAIGAYLNADSVFESLGADSTKLLENIIVKLFDYGYAYEAQLVLDNHLAEADNDASENESFKNAVGELEAIKKCKTDIYAMAAAQFEAGKCTEADFTELLKDEKMSEKGIKALAQIAVTAADAMQAEKEKNLTKASTYYSTALSAINTFGMPADALAAKVIDILMTLGDTQSANSAKETFFKDKEPDAQAAAVLAKLDTLYNAQYAANEVFSPYYYNASYYGAEMDKAEINAALDALIKEDSDKYAKAFVDYYKYLAEAFTDADEDTMEGYLNSFIEAIPEYPFIYGYAAAQLYVEKGDIAKATEIAEKMLAINIADDFANSVMALAKRTEKDVDGSLEIARKGMELSGSVEYSAYHAAVALLIKGEYEEAFSIAKDLYANSLTTNNCELIMVINAKYDGDNEEMKAELKELAAEIEETYASYGVEASDAAKGLIDGTLTFEDVFLGGTFDFS